MVPMRARLVFHAKIERKPYMRRFRRSLLLAVVTLAALGALTEASNRELTDGTIIGIGTFVALALGLAFFYRAVAALLRALRLSDEELRFYDKGFVWTRGKTDHKYSWTDLQAFRETLRSAYIGRWPVFQLGAYVLKMRDGKVFRVTGKYGDLRKFVRPVRRLAADVTGTRMGRALRNQKSVRINKHLVLRPTGLQVKDEGIPWEMLNVMMKRGRLHIQKKTQAGKFKTIAAYNVHQIDNLGGFLEIATTTIRNHQRERFEKVRTRESKIVDA